MIKSEEDALTPAVNYKNYMQSAISDTHLARRDKECTSFFFQRDRYDSRADWIPMPSPPHSPDLGPAMRQLRLHVLVLPWNLPDSSDYLNQRPDNVPPFVLPCQGSVSISRLQELITSRFVATFPRKPYVKHSCITPLR